MTDQSINRFEIGKVLSDAWVITRGTALTLWPVILGFVVAPLVLFGIFDVLAAGNPEAAKSIDRIGNFVTGFLSIPVSISVIFAGLNLLNGRVVTISEALRLSRGRFWPAWGVGVLTGLGVILAMIVFIVPGIFLAVAWSAALPVLLMENTRATSAIGRSFALTKDFRWPTFGALLIVGCIYFGCFILLMILAFLTGLLGMEAIFDVALTPIFVAIITVSGAATQAAIYRELVRIKEGGGSTIADVFV